MTKAIVTIKCATCGKEFTVSRLCANSADANSWKQWAAEHYDTCRECYLEAQRQAEAEEAAEDGLPELEGSEKQIDWALSIRAKFAKEIKNFIANAEASLEALKASGEATPAHSAQLAKCRKVAAKMLSETSCRWWIDNRNTSALRLFDAELKNTPDEPIEEPAEETITSETEEAVAESTADSTSETADTASRAEALIEKYGLVLYMQDQNGKKVPGKTIASIHSQKIKDDGVADEITELYPEILKILLCRYKKSNAIA